MVLLNFPLFNGLPSTGSISTIGPNGNFYGVYTIHGQSGAGMFEVEADGSNLQLFPFYTTQDGAGEPQTMILATDGNFWLANFNGTDGYGDILTISPSTGTVIQTLTPFSGTAAIGSLSRRDHSGQRRNALGVDL